MSKVKEDTGEAVVFLVAGVLVGLAATLLFVRMQRSRANGSKANDDDYYYDGGDLFV